jgi:hypothetical protein
MVPRKTFFVVCLVSSMFCLAGGYGIAGQWVGAVIAIITGAAWLLDFKYVDTLLSHICLLVSVCLAVVGLITGSPPLLMICGSGFALATWDLFSLDIALKSGTYGEQTRRYENKHFQSLALALGCGLILEFAGRLLNFQIPFVVMMLFVALVIFGFDRIWSIIKKQSTPKLM